MFTTNNRASQDPEKHKRHPVPVPTWHNIKKYDIHHAYNQVALHSLTTPTECQKAETRAAVSNLSSPHVLAFCHTKDVYGYQQRLGSFACEPHRRDRRNGRSRNARRLLDPVGSTGSRNAPPKSSAGSRFGFLEIRRPSGTSQWNRCVHSRTSQLQSLALGIFRSHTQRLIDVGFPARQQHRDELPEQSRWAICSAQRVESTRNPLCLDIHRIHGSLYGHEAARRNNHRFVFELPEVLSGHTRNRSIGRQFVFALANQGAHPRIAGCHNSRCLHRKRSNPRFQQPEAFPDGRTQTSRFACKTIEGPSLSRYLPVQANALRGAA
jgi:hypothetical protein